MTENALIVGVGDGLSASLARLMGRKGYDLHLVARDTAKLEALAKETGATLHAADATGAGEIDAVIATIGGRLDVAIYNPSFRVKGPVAELDPDAVRRSLDITAFGAFLTGRAAAARMLGQEGDVRGTILFTGASAGVKGFPESAPFAMGKFAQRGLAQSMARELHPKGIHVAWINIDGAILNPGRVATSPDAMLDPDAIAEAYLQLIDQHRSAWSDELTLRPWVERF